MPQVLRGAQGHRQRNPPATGAERRQAREIARAAAREYRGRGATAVVLGGSWARGDAHRASDVDLWVFGLPAGKDVLWRPPFMVVADRRRAPEELRRLRDPPEIGGSVPGWRISVPLYDPRGVARRLKRTARAFRWERVARRCDRWVARQMVGWAEEVVKLVRALASGDRVTAAVQRNLLADSLAFVIAIHRRTFWDSENRSWERIGRSVGGRWRAAQRRALGLAPAGFDASCDGALDLYRATALEVRSTFRPEERAIVDFALRVAGRASLPRDGA